MNTDILTTVTNAIEKKLTLQQNVVVAISGGSCTRKSSLVSAFLSNHFNSQCVAISQDQFQWQPTYLKKIDPIYKWDHPNNFNIEQCHRALSGLQQNKTVKIPDYQFKKEQEVGFKIITPKPVIIFEGLYANFNRLNELNDISIYVESPWYARMIRRIFRNTLDRYKRTAYQPILQSFCNSVTAAHYNFVVHQKGKSDYTVNVPLVFDRIIERYGLKPVEHDLPRPSIEHTLAQQGDIKIILSINGSDQVRFFLFYKEQAYLHFKISNTLATQLKSIDWLAY